MKTAGRVLSSTTFAARAACSVVDQLDAIEEYTNYRTRKEPEYMADEEAEEFENYSSDSDSDDGRDEWTEQ